MSKEDNLREVNKKILEEETDLTEKLNKLVNYMKWETDADNLALLKLQANSMSSYIYALQLRYKRNKEVLIKYYQNRLNKNTTKDINANKDEYVNRGNEYLRSFLGYIK